MILRLGRSNGNKEATSYSKKPPVLILAEAVLLLLITLYICKICFISMNIKSHELHPYIQFFMFVFDMIMMFIALDAIMGISSKKPKAWRKVIRSTLIMLTITLLGTILQGHINLSSTIIVNVNIAIPIFIPLLILMFLPSVRAYYTPPMMENKPLSDWIRFIGYKPLYPHQKYVLKYKDEESG